MSVGPSFGKYWAPIFSGRTAFATRSGTYLARDLKNLLRPASDLAPPPGLEPGTLRLTAECSAN